MIDLYCERLDPGLWAEPVNAITNLAFLIAAVAIAHTARERQQLNLDISLLIALMLTIGIGSVLFHTFATRWARSLDELPILLFQCLYLWLHGRRIQLLSPLAMIIIVLLFLAAIFLGAGFPQLLNGSLAYAPALVTLVLLGLYQLKTSSHRRLLLLVASGVFLAALIFRSIDLQFCDSLPIGTHFLWHLCNGLVLYLVGLDYLMQTRRQLDLDK